MEIHQYWTVTRQTQRLTTPSFAKKSTAVQSLKKGKSAGIDNIPAKLVQAGGEDIITALTTMCNKIWQPWKWPTPWTPSLVITRPKKRNLRQCQNYRTISLISHPSKVMLKIILNRLKAQAETIIAEEQAGFREGFVSWCFEPSQPQRITTELIQRRKKHRSADLQPTNPMWYISSAPARPLPRLHRLQEGLRQGLACSFVGSHEEVQHQHQSYPSKTFITRPQVPSSSTAA